MDSLTQAVLGAAVGEAVLGKKVGNKAAAWGAVAGTLPDLDVLLNPFLSDVAQLVFHRSLTHSFLFIALMTPVFGTVIARFYRDGPATWRDWSWLAFAALFTHPLLDCFTTYGTQVFFPFSTYPISFNSIFIIDPLYTLPLAAGLLLALRNRPGTTRRRLANRLGLFLSCAYLLITVVNQTIAMRAFTEALDEQGLAYERIATRPTPLNALLWIATADDGSGYWVGLYSLLDGDRPIRFQRLDNQAALLNGIADHPDVQRLLWFSRGYFHVQRQDGLLTFNDIRFGRSDGWLRDEGDYVFSFYIQRDPADSTRVTSIEQKPFTSGLDGTIWRPLLARIGGR